MKSNKLKVLSVFAMAAMLFACNSNTSSSSTTSNGGNTTEPTTEKVTTENTTTSEQGTTSQGGTTSSQGATSSSQGTTSSETPSSSSTSSKDDETGDKKITLSAPNNFTHEAITLEGVTQNTQFNNEFTFAANAFMTSARIGKITKIVADVFGTYDNMKMYQGSSADETKLVTATTGTSVANASKGKLYTYTFTEPTDEFYFVNSSGYQVHMYTIDIYYEGEINLDEISVSEVKLSETEDINLQLGGKKQLSVSVLPAGASQEVKWESSVDTVASVSETGLVTALAAGETTITVSSVADNTKQASVKVIVSDDVKLEDKVYDLTAVTGGSSAYKPYTLTTGGNEFYASTASVSAGVTIGLNKNTNIANMGELPAGIKTALGDKIKDTQDVQASLEMKFDVENAKKVSFNVIQGWISGSNSTFVYILKSVDSGATWTNVYEQELTSAIASGSNVPMEYEETTAVKARYAIAISGNCASDSGARLKMDKITVTAETKNEVPPVTYENVSFNVSDVELTDDKKQEKTDSKGTTTYYWSYTQENMGSNLFSLNDTEIKFFIKTEGVSDVKSWDIDASSKDSVLNQGTKYTHRIKSNGSNNKLQLELKAAATVKIEAISSSSSDKPRAIQMQNTNGNAVIAEKGNQATLDGSSIHLLQYEISEAGIYQWGAFKDNATEYNAETNPEGTTKAGGFNIYYVSIEYKA